MANKQYRECSDHEEEAATPVPNLRTKGHSYSRQDRNWNIPKPPGNPRKIHKPLGRKVKVTIQGNT